MAEAGNKFVLYHLDDDLEFLEEVFAKEEDSMMEEISKVVEYCNENVRI